MTKNKPNIKRKVCVYLDEEAYRRLKVRSAVELKDMGRLITQWVDSWREKTK